MNDPRALVTILAPDPFPLAAMLREAVERDGRGTSAIARAAGLKPQAVSRVLRDDRETQPETIRAILRACGMRLVVVPVETTYVSKAVTSDE